MGKAPFIQGMDAFRAGIPRDGNPYKGKIIAKDDEYPGAWANWDDGWRHQKGADEYDEKLRKGNKAK